ncbi:MAG: SPOR domain-containing protein [Alphaproteobacteria bacterium]|nr:SPOR domain-containing protein [Alphaproteobacteria bacterium]OJV45643.1 MAG: hypothetical protein BGO28_02130 [Alphaproteobacteria bacterium 43-37]
MKFERKDPYLYQQRQAEPTQRTWSTQETQQEPAKFHWSMLFDSPQKIIAISLVILVGFGVGMYTLLTPDTPTNSHNDVPLIKPIPGPMKEIPNDPGGIQVPHQDKLIYQRLETHQLEEKEPTQLLPDASDVSYPPLEAQPNASLPEASQSPATSNTPNEQANFDAWPKATPVHMAARKTQPQEITTTTEGPILSTTTVVDTPQSPTIQPQAQEAVPALSPVPLAEAPANTLPTQAQPSLEEEVSAPPVTSPVSQPINDEAPATSKAVKQEPRATAKNASPTTKAISPHSFRLQIASLSSMKAAETEKKRLWAKHKNILGKFDGKIMRVDLGNSGVRYRVVAGPVSSHKKAKELCNKLGTEKVGCIIMKPGS